MTRPRSRPFRAPGRRELRELRSALESAADPVYREGSLRVAPTALEVLGVRTPDLRAVAVGWSDAHRAADPETVHELAEGLWSAGSREERALGLEILRRFPAAVAALSAMRLRAWAADVDDWGTADLLATAILGPWVLSDRSARMDFLYELVAADGVWRPRLALVSTVPLSRDGSASLDFALSLCDRVLGRREPMITKAVSWALRELAKSDPRRASLYLRARGDSLPAFVRREVGNVLRTGTKSGRVRRAAS